MEKNKNGKLFYSRFQAECDRLNKSVNQIERELGYPRNAMHNYKYGTIPSGKRLIEIAKYFNVSPDYLIGEKYNSNSSSAEMKKFFQNLNLKNKKELCKICQEWMLSSCE